MTISHIGCDKKIQKKRENCSELLLCLHAMEANLDVHQDVLAMGFEYEGQT